MIAVAAAAFLHSKVYLHADVEPVYQGRTLSAWVIDYDQGWYPDFSRPNINAEKLRPAMAAQNKLAEAAIMALGTNSIPMLIQWLRYDEPRGWVSRRVGQLVQRLKYKDVDFLPRRAGAARRALVTLGTRYDVPIQPLYEILTTSCQDAESDLGTPARRAGFVLARLGEKSVPAFAGALTNKDPHVRERASFYAMNMGTNARPLVPLLLRAINDDNIHVADESLFLLNQLKVDPKLIVSELIETMRKNKNDRGDWAMEKLSYYGSNARPAAPLVLEFLHGPYSGYSFRAEKWMRKIAPDILTNTSHSSTKRPLPLLLESKISSPAK